MLGRIGDPFLVVGVERRGLNLGVAEHGLHLVNRRAPLEGDRGRGVAERMGGEAPAGLRRAVKVFELERWVPSLLSCMTARLVQP